MDPARRDGSAPPHYDLVELIAKAVAAGKLDLPVADVSPMRPTTGKHGLLFRARDRASGLPVALKVLNPMLANDRQRGREAFAREAGLTRRLQERAKNVVRLTHQHDASTLVVPTDFGPFSMRIEYFGIALYPQTLLDHIKERSRSLSGGLSIFRDVAMAVRQMHADHVCHRDLKPDNCFIRSEPGNRIGVVGDLGEACDLDAPDFLRDLGEDYAMVMWGEMRYVAPEYFVGLAGTEDLKRVDYYSLGCVLYELSTGKVLAEDIQDVFNQLKQARRKVASFSPGPKRRAAADALLAHVATLYRVPIVGVQPPIPGPRTSHELQGLLARLCTADPQARLCDSDDLLRRVDRLIEVAKSEEVQRV